MAHNSSYVFISIYLNVYLSWTGCFLLHCVVEDITRNPLKELSPTKPGILLSLQFDNDQKVMSNYFLACISLHPAPPAPLCHHPFCRCASGPSSSAFERQSLTKASFIKCSFIETQPLKYCKFHGEFVVQKENDSSPAMGEKPMLVLWEQILPMLAFTLISGLQFYFL